MIFYLTLTSVLVSVLGHACLDYQGNSSKSEAPFLFSISVGLPKMFELNVSINYQRANIAVSVFYGEFGDSKYCPENTKNDEFSNSTI